MAKKRYNVALAKELVELAKRMRAKFKDIVNELHWKTIRFLVDNFDVILLPTFETKQMATRKIRAKSVRSMLTYSFYRFGQRLEWKCASLGKTVIRCCEAYTSKTASWTGEIIQNLGGRKWIKSCGEKVNRDFNGARGILLRGSPHAPIKERGVIAFVNIKGSERLIWNISRLARKTGRSCWAVPLFNANRRLHSMR